MSIANEIISVKKTLEPFHAKLIAVSKTKPAELIKEAYESGHKIFGENKVQELREKQPILPQDIEWHMIGHLQTNKVKFIAPYISLIHSVDSKKLIHEINKQGIKNKRTIPFLLQVHIAKEDSKFGIPYTEAISFVEDYLTEKLTNIELVGLMGMATNTEDKEIIKKEFDSLKELFDDIKDQLNLPNFTEISMGMSKDYNIALESGSTMIRVGSSIFGKR